MQTPVDPLKEVRTPAWLRQLDPRASLRARILWVVSALAIATALLTSYVAGSASWSQVRSDKGELMAELAWSMADQMDKGVHERLREIRIVASLDAIRDPAVPLERKRALLETLKATYENYAWIGLTDASGNILVGTDDLLVGKSVSKRDWFIKGTQGPHVGDVHDAFLLAKILPKPRHDFLPLRLLDVSAPILDAKGELVGVICGHLSWDWSFQVRNALMEPLRNHAETDVLIVNREGHLLLGTPALQQLAPQLNLPSMAAARSSGSGYLTELGPDGENYLTGYAASRGHGDYPGLGWTVLVRQPVQRAFAAAEALRGYTFYVGLVFAALFTAVLTLVVSRFTGPTLAIAAAAERIRDGDTDARIPLFRGRDEAAILSTALSGMVDTLQQMNRQLTQAARVFESSTEGIMITDAEQNILSVNAAFSEITGYSAGDVLGRHPRLLASGRHDTSFYRAMWAAIVREGKWQGEVWNRRKDGSSYPEWLIITTVKNEQGEVAWFIGIFTDITERKKAEERILFLARHDGLTGLPNRMVYFDRLEQALRQAQRRRTQVAVLFIDLDRFKNVNDSLGHDVGDRMLVEVAHRLREAVGDEDTVARLGGDEFVVILPDMTAADEAAQLALDITIALTRPYRLDGQYELNITASIGISVYPEDGDDVLSLTKYADTAMFHAKANGRSGYTFFTPALDEQVKERLALESGLRTAVEKGELYLLYQPQYRLADERIVGCEALLRWHHPELGLVSPTKFIPVAEETGLIGAIGEWVLRSACEQLSQWQRAGLAPLQMAVNLSTSQFRDPHLTDKVQAILEENGVSPKALELEVTESMLMDSPLAAVQVIETLHRLGVRFAIDDFGTGYSSLSYLSHLAVDVLKVDRSFVADLAGHADGGAIVDTIIGMAHNLRLSVIAEGIETPEQRDFLKEHGCELGQGYLFARPLPAEELSRLLQAQGAQSLHPAAVRHSP